jgi:hypothetical protein
MYPFSYVVSNRYTRPFKYPTISEPPSFEVPKTLSTKVIGTWSGQIGETSFAKAMK